jgi:YD repeat-containing protein
VLATGKRRAKHAGLHFSSKENEEMKTLTVAALTLAMITAASAQTSTTFRDASGRTIGTVTTDSNGTKTFRDGSGRTTGTATTDSNGTTRPIKSGWVFREFLMCESQSRGR